MGVRSHIQWVNQCNSDHARFTGRDGSNNFVKKAPSSFSKKKNNTMSKTEDELCRVRLGGTQKDSIRLQIDKMNLICINQKKAADVLPRSGGDNCYDLDEQFGRDSCYDQDDCMWLSSDISFRSSFSSHQSLDEWFVSWLLISKSSYLIGGRGITFFDGSIINPIEEASLALENSIQNADKILTEEKEEDVLTWLLGSTGNDAVTPVSSSVTCIGSPESSYLQTSEDLTSSEMSTTLSTHLDSPSRKLDLDKPSFWVSLLNLDEEDSKWISDTESELDSFQSDFPSPSFNSRCCSEGLSSRSSVSSFTELRHKTSEYDPSSEHASNDVELGNINNDGPLFWPFEWKFDWSSSDCFSMSPCKDIGKLGSPLKTPPKFHGLGKVNTKEGCNRRLVFSSTPTTTNKILEHKHKTDKKCVKRVETTTSRLRKTGKACMKIVPLDMNYDIIKATGENVAKERLACADPNFLEGDFASHEELQIELLMGLGEFDGHEGVDLEFDKDDFFLNESL